MAIAKQILRLAVLAAGLSATAAAAQSSPVGVWLDQDGRGAVEIKECGGALCGHVVWVKDANHRSACRGQILGDLKPVGSNTWDNGWIVNPDDNKRYSVEVKPLDGNRLQVMGYMGTKWLSQTFTWTRAPANLERCDTREAAAPPPQTTSPTPAPQQPAATPDPQIVPQPPRQPQIAQPVPPAPPAQPQVAPPPQQQAGAAKGRECTIEAPFVTIKYQCDAAEQLEKMGQEIGKQVEQFQQQMQKQYQNRAR